MPKYKLRTTLLRLVEAGQLTRHALLAPLVERGLEPGDDVLLGAVAGQPGLGTTDLAAALALSADQVGVRLERLVARDLVVLTEAGVALTERGARLCDAIALASAEIEAQLFAGIGDKHRKSLDRSLRTLLDTLHGQ